VRALEGDSEFYRTTDVDEELKKKKAIKSATGGTLPNKRGGSEPRQKRIGK
jgi:hypothetical protein